MSTYSLEWRDRVEGSSLPLNCDPRKHFKKALGTVSQISPIQTNEAFHDLEIKSWPEKKTATLSKLHPKWRPIPYTLHYV